jgi:acyl-CoA synthetase (AMP-forming)/AMP-acid ligase II
MYRFERVSHLTTPAVLAAVAASHPGRPFILAEDGELTYGMMARCAARLANQFRALGLRPGDRAGILLPNGIRWCATPSETSAVARRTLSARSSTLMLTSLCYSATPSM